MAAGAVLTVAGPFLVGAAAGLGTSLISVHVPSTQTDNPVFALPLYLIGLLLQCGAVLMFQIVGLLIGLTGLVILVVGLIQWLRSRERQRQALQ